MATDKMFLKAFIGRNEGSASPNIQAVDFQVRTGVSVPAKRDMMQNDLVLVTWRYQVKDPDAFKAQLTEDEEPLTGPAFKGSALLKKWLYHGTYAVSSEQSPRGSFETIWSSRKSDLGGLRAVLAGPARPPGSLEERVRTFVSDLRRASTLLPGQDFPEVILDPTSDDGPTG